LAAKGYGDLWVVWSSKGCNVGVLNSFSFMDNQIIVSKTVEELASLKK
jgi:hypothetical protein